MQLRLPWSWRASSWLAALALTSPILVLLIYAVSAPSPIFSHLWETVLWDYIANSLILVCGVCFFATLWGLPSAWFVARYDFYGRRWFRFLLIAPLVLPAYLVAYVYTEWLDYAGPVQIWLRATFELENQSLFEIRSLPGAIFVLSLVLFPYIYWLLVVAFSRQNARLSEASQLLGVSRTKEFWQIALPLARPALAVGITLVALETLADFGAVSYFSVWHLTTGIYDTWLGYSDLSAAAKLSVCLLIFVLLIVFFEQKSRQRLGSSGQTQQPLPLHQVSTGVSLLMMLWCSLVLALGFVLPVSMLLLQAVRYAHQTQWTRFAELMGYSLSLALAVAVIAALLALLFHVVLRSSGRASSYQLRLSSLGYAVPGTVMGIAVLIAVLQFDKSINHLLQWLGADKVGLLLGGTLFAMGFAFLCRFQAIANGSVGAVLELQPKQQDEAAYLLGASTTRIARKLWLPLAKPGVLTAFLLVFLESMKELSAAILLRPFNVDTLTTYVYEFMSTDQFELAALPALVIILAGLPTIWVIQRSMNLSSGAARQHRQEPAHV